MGQLFGLIWKELSRRKSFCPILLHVIVPLAFFVVTVIILATEKPASYHSQAFRETYTVITTNFRGKSLGKQLRYWCNCSKSLTSVIEDLEIQNEPNEHSVISKIKHLTFTTIEWLYNSPVGNSEPRDVGVVVRNVSHANIETTDVITLKYYVVPHFDSHGASNLPVVINRIHVAFLARLYRFYEDVYASMKNTETLVTKAIGLNIPVRMEDKGNIIPFLSPTVWMMLHLTVLFNNILSEKQSKLKDLLRISGVGCFNYYLSYFIVDGLLLVLPSALYLFFPRFLGLSASHGPHYILATVAYAIALMLFTFGLTVFFGNQVLGNSIFAFLIALTGAQGTIASYSYLPYELKLVLALYPPYSYDLILEELQARARQEESVSVAYWFQTSKHPNSYAPGHIITVMLLSCFLYILLILYVEHAWFFQTGQQQPQFSSLRWFSKKSASKLNVKFPKNSSYFQKHPSCIKSGIKVVNIKKDYGCSRKVLKDVDLEIYYDQITVLVGPNGSGKTTLLNVMTGLESFSDGRVLIDVADGDLTPKKTKSQIGCCPQVNALYDTLTVWQHLYIFCMVKQYDKRNITDEIKRVLALVKLTDKASAQCLKLSGGQKRRLQLALAFIGGSKILVFDEPSSGLDVEARQAIWDILLENKNHHLIFMTTNYIEEAECLGDRVAIFHDGDVKCCGSPVFLKNTFQSAYILRLFKYTTVLPPTCTEFVRRALGTAVLKQETKNEVIFTFKKDDIRHLPKFCENLEERKEQMGISSCAISRMTLEDVFIKVIEKFEKTKTPKKDPLPFRVPLRPNCSQQLGSLMMKRWNMIKRSALLPFFIVVGLFVTVVFFLAWRTFLIQTQTKEFSSLLPKDNFTYSCQGNHTICNDYFPSMEYSSTHVSRLLRVALYEDSYCLVLESNHYDMFDAATQTINGMLGWLFENENKSVYVEAQIVYPTHYFRVDTMGFACELLASALSTSILGTFILSFRSVSLEKRSNAMFLQRMTGAKPLTYWLANYCFDFLMSVILLLPVILVLPFLETTLKLPIFFSSPTNAVLFYTILILFVLASLTQAYCMTLIGISLSAGVQIQIILTIVSVLIDILAKHLNYHNTFSYVPKTVGFYIIAVFRVVLAFSPSTGIRIAFRSLIKAAYEKDLCANIKVLVEDLCTSKVYKERTEILNMCCKTTALTSLKSLFTPIYLDEKPGVYVGISLLIMIFSFGALISSEYVRKGQTPKPRKTSEIKRDLNSDVAKERRDTEELFKEQKHTLKALTVLDLTKHYKNSVIVNKLTFTVENSQCFGFLGVNGAGKTTTIKMLVGEIGRTAGESFIGRFSISADFYNYQRRIGYCPQMNCFVDGLTGEEMLRLFANIRGIDKFCIEEAVQDMIQLLGLDEQARRVVDQYSGGNKRRLAVGLAVIGFPQLILLDEPTAAVDASGRRKIWSLLEHAIAQGSSVILTSHALDECEALCQKIVVMVDGNLECVGSMQELRGKFSKGMTLKAKVKPSGVKLDDVKNTILTSFPNAVVKETYGANMVLNFKGTDLNLGSVYAFMEDLQHQQYIEDYEVFNTTLEHIFLHLASKRPT